MNDLFRRLPVPYFVVIGNHDHLGNGEEIYERMFGPQDFAFTWARTRFVFLDTCSIEEAYDGTVPDLATLAVNLAPSPDHERAFLFAHVKPESTDFDPRLRTGSARSFATAASSHPSTGTSTGTRAESRTVSRTTSPRT